MPPKRPRRSRNHRNTFSNTIQSEFSTGTPSGNSAVRASWNISQLMTLDGSEFAPLGINRMGKLLSIKLQILADDTGGGTNYCQLGVAGEIASSTGNFTPHGKPVMLSKVNRTTITWVPTGPFQKQPLSLNSTQSQFVLNFQPKQQETYSVLITTVVEILPQMNYIDRTPAVTSIN